MKKKAEKQSDGPLCIHAVRGKKMTTPRSWLKHSYLGPLPKKGSQRWSFAVSHISHKKQPGLKMSLGKDGLKVKRGNKQCCRTS